MSFQLNSKSDVLALINAANGTAIKESEVVFSKPIALTGTWEGKPTSHNTAIRVGPSVGSKYKGIVSVTYDRLALEALHNVPNFKIKNNDGVSAYELLDSIRRVTGVSFTEDDVLDLPVVIDGDQKTVTLEAKTDSIGWLNTSVFDVLIEDVQLEDLLTNGDLLGLDYPTESAADTYGQMYLSGYDFTEYALPIKALPTGVLSSDAASALVTTLKAVDVSAGSTLWNTTDGATAWSISGANVVSNGLNTNYALPTNPAFKYVMVLELRNDVPKPKGQLYLHYNEPFDPTL